MKHIKKFITFINESKVNKQFILDQLKHNNMYFAKDTLFKLWKEYGKPSYYLMSWAIDRASEYIRTHEYSMKHFVKIVLNTHMARIKDFVENNLHKNKDIFDFANWEELWDYITMINKSENTPHTSALTKKPTIGGIKKGMPDSYKSLIKPFTNIEKEVGDFQDYTEDDKPDKS